MTTLYTLCDTEERAIGVFSSPELAMEYAYLDGVYQIMQGFRRGQPHLVWINASDHSWRAFTEDAYKQSYFERGNPNFYIHALTLDTMPPNENWIRNAATGLLSQEAVFRGISYQDDARLNLKWGTKNTNDTP